MPKLNVFDFSGGINNEIQPHLIEKRFCSNLINANVESGSCIPYPDKATSDDPDIGYLTYQNGERSVIKWGNEFYWSNNDTSVLESTLGYVGITPPSSPMKLSKGPIGDRFTGVRKYLARFVTDEGFESAPFLPEDFGSLIASVNCDQTETVIQQGSYPDFKKDNYYYYRHGRFYYGYNAGSRVNHKGRSWEADSLIAAGYPNQLADSHAPGLDSRWRDISGISTTISGSDSISISDIPTPFEDKVQSVDIFRTIGGGINYYLLTTLSISDQNFIDTVTDSELQNRDLLSNFTNYPPLYLSNGSQFNRVGGKYLLEVNGVLHLANGNRLFEAEGDPHSWSPVNSTRYPADITGLAKIDNSVIVFIENHSPYLKSGSIVHGDAVVTDIATTQTCSNWKTIAYAKNTPLWQSNDGICGIERRPFSTTWTVEVLTKGRYKFDSIGNWAITHKDIYYLFFDDHVVCFDLGRSTFYKRDITADYGFSTPDDLYLVKNESLFVLDGDVDKEMTVKSANFAMDSLEQLKEYGEIRVDSDGDVTYSTWYDDVLVASGRELKLKNKVRSERLPPGVSYRIQLEFKSKSKIRGYSIEWNNAG